MSAVTTFMPAVSSFLIISRPGWPVFLLVGVATTARSVIPEVMTVSALIFAENPPNPDNSVPVFEKAASSSVSIPFFITYPAVTACNAYQADRQPIPGKKIFFLSYEADKCLTYAAVSEKRYIHLILLSYLP